MADWPQLQDFNPVVISPRSIDSIGAELRVNGSVSSAGAWPTANKAIYVPFVVHQPFTVVKAFVEIGTASGNIDVGVYDDQKNLIVSDGGHAQAGANAIQSFDLTDTTLNPGVYYMAVAANNTTGTIFRFSFTNNLWAGAAGVLTQTSAYPLPSTANWAAAADAYVPFLALTSRTTI